jgi:hypothetical protein
MNSHAHSQYDHPYEDFEALDNVKREDEVRLPTRLHITTYILTTFSSF